MTAWKNIVEEIPADAQTVTIRLIWTFSPPCEATWSDAYQGFTLTATGMFVYWFMVSKWKP